MVNGLIMTVSIQAHQFVNIEYRITLLLHYSYLYIDNDLLPLTYSFYLVTLNESVVLIALSSNLRTQRQQHNICSYCNHIIFLV